jgi:hypothetical protein
MDPGPPRGDALLKAILNMIAVANHSYGRAEYILRSNRGCEPLLREIFLVPGCVQDYCFLPSNSI